MKMQATIWKEGNIYIIKEAITGVTTQGKSIEEAMKNIKEAVSLYLDEMPSVRKAMKNITTIGAMSVEIA